MSDYPHRPTRRKARASENGGGKRKTWLSDSSKIENGRDISPRLGFAWWQAPIYKLARLARWAK